MRKVIAKIALLLSLVLLCLMLTGCTSNGSTSPSANNQTTCCKVCSKGKACGNSCISRSDTCHKAPGCACDE